MSFLPFKKSLIQQFLKRSKMLILKGLECVDIEVFLF